MKTLFVAVSIAEVVGISLVVRLTQVEKREVNLWLLLQVAIMRGICMVAHLGEMMCLSMQ